MKKVSLIILIIFSLKLSAQSKNNLIQEISSNGNFVISVIDDKTYDRYLTDKAKVIVPTENNGIKTLSEFKNLYPEIYNGKCLKINDKKFQEFDIKICDQLQAKEINEKGALYFGTFPIESFLDEFFIFNFSGWEAQSYYIFDSNKKQMHAFGNKPFFSIDKKVIYGYSEDTFGIIFNFLQLDSGNSLRYKLHGKYKIKEVNLTQLKSGSYNLLINCEQLEEWNEISNQYEKTNKNLKISIF